MRRLLKLWMICLIALALPIQGVAAASMLMCGPSHHQHPPATAGHDHTAHSHGTDHHHAAAVQVAPSDSEVSAFASMEAGQQSAAEFDKLSKAKCSACSSCCTAAALPSTVVTFESAPAIDRFLTFAGSSPADFFTSGPDRPPRFFLA